MDESTGSESASSVSSEIRDPIPDSGSSGVRLELWGRLGEPDTELGLALYALLNPGDHTIEEWIPWTHGSILEQESFYPGSSPEPFLRNLRRSRLMSDAPPHQLLEQFTERFEQFTGNDRVVETLHGLLREQNEEGFREWTRLLARGILEKPSPSVQVNGRLVPADHVPDPIRELNEQDRSGSSGEKPRFPVTLINDPVHGRRIKNLDPGTAIEVRITGPIVKQLPEQHIDRSRDPIQSKPTKGILRSVTTADSSAPPEETSSGDLQEVVVDLGQSVQGETTAYGRNRVRVIEEDEGTSTPDFDKRIFIVGGVLLLVLVELTVLIWWLA